MSKNTHNDFNNTVLLHMRALRLVLVVLFAFGGAVTLHAQNFTVPDTSGARRVVRGWVDTGINLSSGARLVQISASGDVDVGGGQRFGPEGTTSFADARGFPAEMHYRYGLVAQGTSG